jgi:dolichol kinase
MDAPLALESRAVALEIHRFLQELDPARFRHEASEALSDRLAQVAAALATLRSHLSEDEVELRRRVAELQDIVAAWRPPEPEAARRRWMALKASMGPAYEGLVTTLQVQDVHVPRLRPTNYKRNAMHLTSWLVALLVIGLSEGEWPMLAVAGSIALAGWTMETGRRLWPLWNERIMAAFNPVAHPHEAHRINSATWYATALTLLAALGSVPVALVAVTVLGVGDPVAAVIGRRWGRIKTLNGRSLEGSLAFAAASVLVTTPPLLLMWPVLTVGQAGLVAGAGSVVGAIAETFCRRVDDNLGVPLAAGAAAGLTLMALGLPI